MHSLESIPGLHKRLKIRLLERGSDSDPDLIRSVDPDPGGQKRPTKIEKSLEISCLKSAGCSLLWLNASLFSLVNTFTIIVAL